MNITRVNNNCKPTPIFDLGQVPCIPHCYIIEREYRQGKWHYAIENRYNSYASGWGDEDFVIDQIKKNKNQ